jgi:HAD superfamily phosphoserine phosphatase-like hydrolase
MFIIWCYFPFVMNRIVFSDFDGTLSKSYISMEFLEFLEKRKLYSEDAYAKQISLVNSYKKGSLSYDDWIFHWANTWALGLKGQRKDVIADAADDFIGSFIPNIYPSSYELMALLKRNDYETVLISVGAYEVISRVAIDLKMDLALATKCAFDKGVYTGLLETDIHLPSGKENGIKKFIEENGYSLKGSVALGDSAHDASMLRLVEHPFCLNPSKELQIIAKSNGWKVCKNEDIVDIISKII